MLMVLGEKEKQELKQEMTVTNKDDYYYRNQGIPSDRIARLSYTVVTPPVDSICSTTLHLRLSIQLTSTFICRPRRPCWS